MTPTTVEPLPLANRVALITGVSRQRGIGFAIMRRLLERGASVFAQALPAYDQGQPWGADAGGIGGLRAALPEGASVAFIEADFSHPEAPQQVMDAARARFGPVDILVANHAYSLMGALEDLDAAHIDAHLQVNVRGTLLLIKAFGAQHDDSRPGGRVILMTSGQHLGPMPGELAYIASKGALHQLTASLSAHLIRRGITVNTVNPGATDTGYADESLFAEVLRHAPLGRWGQPDDAARLIAWLCSDEAHWIMGQVINSTGGGW